MEVIAPHISVHSASISSQQLSLSEENGRYIIPISQASRRAKDSLVVRFSSKGKDGSVGEVALRTAPGKSLRKNGWERLRVDCGYSSKGTEKIRAAHLDRRSRRASSIGGGVEKIKGGYHAYRLLKDGRDILMLSDEPNTADFMSLIPDETPLGLLTLAGTHESCALYGYPLSQCQQSSTTIEQQLLDGIRFLDVRLRVVDDQLLMYHGPRSQRSSLPALLSVLHDFLTAHPTETLILCLKEESPPFHPSFSARVYSAFEPYIEKFWFLEERIPKLGEVRGKGMLMTRFDRDKEDGEGQWPAGMGIHPSTWPDSKKEGFEWDCGGTRVRTQDWYRVHTFLSIPEKFATITAHLKPTLTAAPVLNPSFTLSYTSASYFPLALPTTIAKGFGWPAWGLGVEGINTRLCRAILEWMADGKRIRGCLAMDFYRQCAGIEGLAGLLVQMNSIE
ncbi:hypothetical protein L202_00216 [Cryptococcus amylolentus CBS 6039]|uniref:Phosphatidylinositol-specific phospholipase C X domain-containing protein n=1 Tax=Cryptococcus amylolentus CBS 6039 TaxID=1295533 RepID=A0A1E3I6N3_9TREE|nr:hypothetical protein L202_00216 [Cryptococcus amylolentus CBS 6039]ODN84217.1 hypothetical protein L202_00216 [Cryptococcus amylolentus CBS 6039]